MVGLGVNLMGDGWLCLMCPSRAGTRGLILEDHKVRSSPDVRMKTSRLTLCSVSVGLVDVIRVLGEEEEEEEEAPHLYSYLHYSSKVRTVSVMLIQRKARSIDENLKSCMFIFPLLLVRKYLSYLGVR